MIVAVEPDMTMQDSSTAVCVDPVSWVRNASTPGFPMRLPLQSSEKEKSPVPLSGTMVTVVLVFVPLLMVTVLEPSPMMSGGVSAFRAS